MKHCFGYVRVSSHKQGEGVSLEAQKDAIERFASANDITITNWFEEQQTAAKSGRPVFGAMLKALRARKADGVVMHKIDRSARNYVDWGKIGELADSGVDVHFATESLDFRSRGGRLTANIQMAVAEDYVRNLKAEIHKGQRGQLQRGFYPFMAPIGYLNNGKNKLKTIDPVKGPLIKQAFELYASGQYSFFSLRHELAKRGLTRANNTPISKGCLELFLANPFYTGVIHIRRTGEVYQGAHEPLISPELFQQVADVRAGKQHKKLTRHNYLFRGLFRCGHCHRSMIGERQKGKMYYRCHRPECPPNCIREEPLVEAVRSTLDRIRLTDRAIAMIEARVAQWTRAYGRDKSAQTHAMQLANLDTRLEKLEDAAIEQIIDAECFRKRKQKLLLEKAALEKSQQADAQLHENPAVLHRFLERVKNLAEHYRFADPAEKREIIEIAVSNRTVKDKNVFVEPQKWLQATQHAIADLSCADNRTTSRRPSIVHEAHNKVPNATRSDDCLGGFCADNRTTSRTDTDVTGGGRDEERHLIELVHIARSPEAWRLLAMANEGDPKPSVRDHDYQSETRRL